MWPFRKITKSLGERGEDLAAKHLRRAKYRILGRNIRAGRNEIDIIAQTGDTVVFVEVRTRAEIDPVPPEDTVNREKQRRIIAGAKAYIAAHPSTDTYYRFDVIAVILPERHKPIIKWIKNAFTNK